MLFPWKRQEILQNFLHDVQKEKTVNPQSFWEFREFYSPGYYIFNKNGVSQIQLLTAQKKISVPLKTQYIDSIFLTFTSPHLTSIEALVTTPDVEKIVAVQKVPKKFIIFSGKNEIVYRDLGNNLHIIFVKSESLMATANGFFDYTGDDKNLVTGKYWFDSTVLDTK